jgi:23S rRNA pseudouridine1911/1915/1917 synthase
MPSTVLDWLLERFPHAKRQTFKRMLCKRRILINGNPAKRLSDALPIGAAIRIASRNEKSARSGVEGALNIFFEDSDILVVNKPPGLLTSTIETERRPTLLARVRSHIANQSRKARVGLIHRLDRDAAGLLVFSKNDLAYRSLKSQFFHHDVRRVYLAVVRANPPADSGRIESRLVERADGTVHSTRQPGKGARAITEYEVLRRTTNLALLKVTLHTGRKHQIRAHLSEHVGPIVGDVMYGARVREPSGLLLAAICLGFTHPRTGRILEFQLPIHDQFVQQLDDDAASSRTR